MFNTDEMNKIFSFKDAVRTLENILHETREERDSYGPVEGTGLYNDWDAYYAVQSRVEVLEDALTALTFESSIMHHVREINAREDAS